MSNQAYRLVKRADHGAGRIVAVRIATDTSERWDTNEKHPDTLELDEHMADHAAQSWNDYAATKGFSWRVVAEAV